jgi:hypothetical protein
MTKRLLKNKCPSDPPLNTGQRLILNVAHSSEMANITKTVKGVAYGGVSG